MLLTLNSPEFKRTNIEVGVCGLLWWCKLPLGHPPAPWTDRSPTPYTPGCHPLEYFGLPDPGGHSRCRTGTSYLRQCHAAYQPAGSR